jgi:uncharacterized BrkB/YihY/UPF0761 family membrane protein
MRFERFINWLGFLIALGIAVLLSVGVVLSVHVGRVSSGKSKVVHLLAQDPVGFWSALAVNLVITGTFWYCAYWIYTRTINEQHEP